MHRPAPSNYFLRNRRSASLCGRSKHKRTTTARAPRRTLMRSPCGVRSLSLHGLTSVADVGSGITEAEVKLKFAEEELASAARGVPSVHNVSPSSFVYAGLDLEEEQ